MTRESKIFYDVKRQDENNNSYQNMLLYSFIAVLVVA
jgi:hypothetical protein